MSFQTDGGGVQFRCNDIKILTSGSTWSTRLSQIGKVKGEILICTYSLPNLDYVQGIFAKRPYGIKMSANSRFRHKAQQIKALYPEIEVGLLEDMHKKTLLIEPQTIFIGSANFGKSGWRENCVGFHSPDMFEFCRAEFYMDWQEAEKVRG